MTPPLILMFSGWSGCGKDAAASLLTDELNFYRVAFADALKRDVSHKTDIPLEIFHNVAAKDRPLAHPCKAYPDARTPRDLLLAHALKARAADPAVFAKAVNRQIHDAMVLDQQRFVISDWRYANEYECVRAAFPRARIVRIRIQRPHVEPSGDPSEHELDAATFDDTIMNDGCISDLRDTLRHIVRKYTASSASSVLLPVDAK